MWQLGTVKMPQKYERRASKMWGEDGNDARRIKLNSLYGNTVPEVKKNLFTDNFG